MNHEDQHLCSGEGLVIGSNASPHIRTCWCRRGYEGDGFFCEGIVTVIFPENLSVYFKRGIKPASETSGEVVVVVVFFTARPAQKMGKELHY